MGAMNVTFESVRRGLTPIAKRLGFILSDGFVEWMRAIYAEEKPRPSWLLPPDEWEDLAAYLDERGQVWPGRAGIVVGEPCEGMWVVLCDAERRLADKPTQVPVEELVVPAHVPAPVRREGGEWVHHGKFGLGEIVERLGPDRVRVRFDGVVRTMLKDRLEPARAPAAQPAPAKDAPDIEDPVVRSLLFRRYGSGEHLQVYEELLRERATDAIALGMAREMMRRVRHDVELLADRWRRHGFALRDPVGPRAGPLHVEAPLPPTLRAFYEELGWIDFVASPPSDGRWPDEEALDALQVLAAPSPEALDEQTDDGLVWPLFEDPLVKIGRGGVGGVYALLSEDEPRFDASLWFEGSPLGDTFVSYLRKVILEGGGIGPTGIDDAARALVEELTRDLVVFCGVSGLHRAHHRRGTTA